MMEDETGEFTETDAARVKEILDNLPEADRSIMQKMLDAQRRGRIQGAAAQVMARNFSHNCGDTIREELKKKR